VPKKSADNRRAKNARAEYVIQCIRDQPWLDGQYTKLGKLVSERYDVSHNPAEEAVTMAYEWMDKERERNVKNLVGYLDRTHRATIELGHRTADGRIITPAAAELRKLHGVGEGERIQLSGTVGNHITTDDAALLGALKLTNAQRQAEIDKLAAELEGAPRAPVTTTTQNEGDGEDDDE
jgi:hypothetical protein